MASAPVPNYLVSKEKILKSINNLLPAQAPAK
jgi:hypothetical protein